MQNWCTNNAKNCIQGIIVGDFPHMVIKAYEQYQAGNRSATRNSMCPIGEKMHFVLDGMKIIRVYMNMEVMIAVIKIRLRHSQNKKYNFVVQGRSPRRYLERQARKQKRILGILDRLGRRRTFQGL